MLIIDREEFFANLEVTQAYCAWQLQQPWQGNRLALRSSIRPVFKNQQWFVRMPGEAPGREAPAVTLEEWTRATDPYCEEVFADAFARQLAFKQQVVAEVPPVSEYRGRILVVEYGLNIPDGVTEAETDGFFDEFDLPPIDTWFYKGDRAQGILFAWIPAPFIDLAEKAVSVQFLDILQWFVKPPKWAMDTRARLL